MSKCKTYYERKNAGLCTNCGGPLGIRVGHVRCEACVEKMSKKKNAGVYMHWRPFANSLPLEDVDSLLVTDENHEVYVVDKNDNWWKTFKYGGFLAWAYLPKPYQEE